MADAKGETPDKHAGEKPHLSDREGETTNEHEQVTMASFAHLDEKKILRKVRDPFSTGSVQAQYGIWC